MVVESKRKKHHDKDKYYRLAKEQGLRSRAAFKLTQINRKFPVLEKCTTAVLDLCAAPGGWTQIVARTCPRSVEIVAVDILPIRSMGHTHPNVTTLIGDITTDQCKADIKRTLQSKGIHATTSAGGGQVDVVLHDGAPNIGAEYGKDAYEQNEMTLHAVRVASQHLKRTTGVFITKVYRSRDYASLQWIFQQLFATVTTFKPKASRTQSSEIFVVCQGFIGPTKAIDAKFFDPKHVFASVEGETTGGAISEAHKKMNIFDKNWDKPVRKRGGYDTDHLDFTMRHDESVMDFISADTSLKDAIQMLSRCTGIKFGIRNAKPDKPETNFFSTDISSTMTSSNSSAFSDDEQYVLNHPLTSNEIKESLADLQVLNKTAFKELLNWRMQMQEALKIKNNDNPQQNDDTTSVKSDNGADDSELDSDQEEEIVQEEIEQMRVRRMKERKRQLKKERALAAKRRKRAALVGNGSAEIDLNDILPEHDQIFSLATIPSKKALELASEVNLDQVTDEHLFGDPNQDEEEIYLGKNAEEDDDDSNDDKDATTWGLGPELLKKRERELNDAYELYLQTTKDGLAKSGTKMAKRSKKLMRQKVVNEAFEDAEMAMTTDAGLSYDAKAYAKLLHGNDADADDDSESDDEEGMDDDGFHDTPMTPEEAAAAVARKKSKQMSQNMSIVMNTTHKNPLLHEFEDNEPTSAKTSRWFSNPLFVSILGKASTATTTNTVAANAVTDNDDNDDSESETEVTTSNNKKKTDNQKLTADEVLAMMPKTEKQKRHEKRLKQMEKDKRKQERLARKAGDMDAELQIVPSEHTHPNNGNQTNHQSNNSDDNDFSKLSVERQKKIKEARELIKAGMGSYILNKSSDTFSAANNGKIEIVSASETEDATSKTRVPDDERPLPIMDDRKFDSDHEEYDSDDYAETLALGTMLIRNKSKEKAFVDASYNRYAWNDPTELPEWFVDDEKKHYRPQLPIPPALVAKIKEQMVSLSVKPIKKVAEARARKNKRAKLKLLAAKKKAEAVAKSPDMSEAMKLKAISKALQQGKSGSTIHSKDGKKKFNAKPYVVAKKGRNLKVGGNKGSKVVDKRMKCDTRSMKRAETKKKGGSKTKRRK